MKTTLIASLAIFFLCMTVSTDSLYCKDVTGGLAIFYDANGDGRCFLFRIVLDEENKCYKGGSDSSTDKPPPESKCWKWQPADLFDLGSATMSDDQNDTIDSSSKSHASAQAALETFQISTKDFLGMGGNDKGGSGLRLNEDLTKAESSCAAGFDNEPLLPGAGGMFEVGLLEAGLTVVVLKGAFFLLTSLRIFIVALV